MIKPPEGDGKKFTNKVDLGMDRLVLMHDIGITDRYVLSFEQALLYDVDSEVGFGLSGETSS